MGLIPPLPLLFIVAVFVWLYRKVLRKLTCPTISYFTDSRDVAHASSVPFVVVLLEWVPNPWIHNISEGKFVFIWQRDRHFGNVSLLLLANMVSILWALWEREKNNVWLPEVFGETHPAKEDLAPLSSGCRKWHTADSPGGIVPWLLLPPLCSVHVGLHQSKYQCCCDHWALFKAKTNVAVTTPLFLKQRHILLWPHISFRALKHIYIENGLVRQKWDLWSARISCSAGKLCLENTADGHLTAASLVLNKQSAAQLASVQFFHKMFWSTFVY